MTDPVRLSANEMVVLPSRVFAAAGMPVGCVGGAAEAVSFLEYALGHGLKWLDTDKEALLASGWRPPSVIFETATAALCDAKGESALFAAPAMTEWIAAMAREHSSAVLGIVDVTHAHYLAAVPYALALRGLSGMTVHATENAQIVVTIALTHRTGWRYAYLDCGGLPRRAVDPSPPALTTLSSHAAEWLTTLRSGAAPGLLSERTGWLGLARTTCLIVAVADREQPIHPDAGALLAEEVAAAGKGSMLRTDQDLAAARRRTMGSGWPIDGDLWARLMAFADRTLIPTSEESRLGAG